ncbi:unnamed protein product [Fusarium graminearum]|nr:unnamed protein product [Fusarium graminearum]CAG1964498.1 unnamed protein product [Fusarium graminearum]CAG1989150.1 unnamed protein product [Fusarium graminearum]VTO88415.1 unnamed protein product [Fusarium graminearum]
MASGFNACTLSAGPDPRPQDPGFKRRCSESGPGHNDVRPVSKMIKIEIQHAMYVGYYAMTDDDIDCTMLLKPGRPRSSRPVELSIWHASR